MVDHLLRCTSIHVLGLDETLWRIVCGVDCEGFGTKNLNWIKSNPRGDKEIILTKSVPQNLIESKRICPHCWHHFYSDEAWYISRHPEFGAADDVLLNEPKRFSPSAVKNTRDGQVLDPKNWEMVERACPRCHLQLSPELLQKQPYIISIVGSPKSGKTYFLTTMIHDIRKELVNYFGFSLQDTDSHFSDVFHKYEQDLYSPINPDEPAILKKTEESGDLYNKIRIDGADVQLPKPFIFSLKPTQANLDVSLLGPHLNRNIVFYDNAGESFQFGKDKGHDRATMHLAKCNAVFFTFDPLQDAATREQLATVSSDPQLTSAAYTTRQETFLEEIIHRMYRHRCVPRDQRLNTILAVCVQKYDVWKTLVPHATDEKGYSLIDHTSVEYIQSKGVAGVDLEEVNCISLLIRQFLMNICPEFVALAETSFRLVRYFPVSALGTSPEYEVGQQSGLLKIHPRNLRPWRVTHPLLWCLHDWKLIRRTRPDLKNIKKYPHATVISIEGDRIRLQSPYNQRTIVVDLGYAGSTIIDPHCGQKLWIPELPSQSINAEPAKKAPSTQLSEVPTLKLNETRPPTKGWFRKH